MNKILSLEIFDATIFEGDAVDWLAKCKEQKREWILKHTSQTNEEAITEFINNPKISKDCKCLDCGKAKKELKWRPHYDIYSLAKEMVSEEIKKINAK